jgi:maltose O-acetyltransferase
VSIGENSIIGAGAVVTRSIPPNSVAVGNPARVIKALDPSVSRAIEAANVGVISLGETGERA